MNRDRTAAKMGRSMKNRENIYFFSAAGFSGGACGLSVPACGFGRGNLHRSARPELHQPVDDDSIAGLQAFGDDPVIACPFAERDRTRLGGAFFIDDVDELSLRA